MRIVLQRVARASVTVGAEEIASIETGLLALVGIAEGDTVDDADRLAAKTIKLRLFARGDRPFDRSVADVDGGVLVVSQFTLLGDLRRGNRPSWSQAARPGEAEPLVARYAETIERHGVVVRRGRFGAAMAVSLENDGPVTLLLDSRGLAPVRPAGPGAM